LLFISLWSSHGPVWSLKILQFYTTDSTL